MNNTQVGEAFTKGSTKAKGSNMFIDGDTIYSYGYHFPIATRIKPTVAGYVTYLFNKDRYSNSTARQMSHVYSAIRCSGGEVIECTQTEGGWGVKAELKIDLDYLSGKIDEAHAKATRARTEHMRELWEDDARRYEVMLARARTI